MSEQRPWTQRRTAWGALALSALALEAMALWFQHGMGLAPCVMCIYERLAVIGIALAGLIGLLAPHLGVVRLAGYLLWAASVGWGLVLVREHIRIQVDPAAAMSCSFSPDFPTWARLDDWLPSVFLPTGFCDDIQWQWLSLTMVEWVGVAFVIYLMTLSVVLWLEWRSRC